MSRSRARGYIPTCIATVRLGLCHISLTFCQRARTNLAKQAHKKNTTHSCSGCIRRRGGDTSNTCRASPWPPLPDTAGSGDETGLSTAEHLSRQRQSRRHDEDLRVLVGGVAAGGVGATVSLEGCQRKKKIFIGNAARSVCMWGRVWGGCGMLISRARTGHLTPKCHILVRTSGFR